MAVATALAVCAVIVLSIIIFAILAIREGEQAVFPDYELLGLPIGLWILGGQQLIFIGAAWRFSVAKYGLSYSALGLNAPRGRLPYLQAIGAWIVMIGALVGWAAVVDSLGIDALKIDDNTDVFDEIGGGLFATVLVAGIWGPFAEEVFFRGFMLAGMRRRFGAFNAILASAGVFALFHIDPSLFVPILIFGIVLGWLFVKTESIWPSVLAHALNNSTVFLVSWES